MNFLEGLLLVVHIGVALAICGFVLLQHGKGADMGAAFGSGASGSLFGASGSANFLSHTTAVLAAVFFVTSVSLTWYASSQGGAASALDRSVLDKLPPKAAPGAPSTPPSGTAPATPPTGGSAPAGSAPATAPAGAPAGSKAGEVPK
jgi:preprotein translocase subunit SecG